MPARAGPISAPEHGYITAYRYGASTRNPASARGNRDEQQLRSGELSRRIVIGVDLQAAPAQPAHALTHVGERRGPAALAQLRRSRDHIGLDDPAARPVGQHGLRPDPLQQAGRAFGQIGPVQHGRHRTAQRYREARAISAGVSRTRASSSPNVGSPSPAGAGVRKSAIQRRPSAARMSCAATGSRPSRSR